MQRSGSIRVLPNQVQPIVVDREAVHAHLDLPSRHEVEKCQESHMKHCLIYTIILLVIYIEFYHSKTTTVDLGLIKEEYYEIWLFVQLTMGLYLLQIIYHILLGYLTTSGNMRYQIISSIAIFVLQAGVTFFGLAHSWSQKMNEMTTGKGRRYVQLNFMVQILIWLRLWLIVLCGMFLLCMIVFVISNLTFGTQTEISRHNKHLSRIPGVSQYIASRSRSFDPAKDQEVGTCMICLEEFSSSKPVAELNCC